MSAARPPTGHQHRSTQPADATVSTVLLVDDLADALAMVRAAVEAAFPHARCMAARSVHEAMGQIQLAAFDLALVDLSLGDGSGLAVIEQLTRLQPSCAIVVSTIHDDDDNLFRALQAGAQGYLLKDHPKAWLVQQLQGIAQGQPPLSPAIARRLLRHFRPPAPTLPSAGSYLSTREREVLGLLAQGVRIAEIGTALDISRHTVGDHVKNIYRKLNIGSRAEAALHARSLGLA